MRTLIITKNDMELFDNNDKVNANDILKEIWNSDNHYVIEFQLTTFFSKYDELSKDSNFKKQYDINALLSICNLPNPNIRYNLDLNSDKNEINNYFKDYKENGTVQYVYTTVQELLSSILYHYILNGLKLKQCAICDSFFLTKYNKTICCCDECNSTYKSQKEMKRRSKDEVAYLYKLVNSMLENRGDDYSDQFKIDYKFNKKGMTRKQLIKWLKETHQKYKRR